jgi:hypothetical protein
MSDLWYYTIEGRQRTPVPSSELRRLAAEGSLKPNDLVWREGMPRWVRARSADLPEPLVFPVHPEPPTAAAEPGRRPHRTGPSAGMNLGVVVATFLFGLVLIGILAVGLAIYLIANSGPPHHISTAVTPGPTEKSSVTYTVDLEAGQNDVRPIALTAQVRYEIVVVSDQNTDVDLFIFDGDREEAKDIEWNKDARVLWTPPASKAYRFELHNLGPVATRSHVTIRQFPRDNAGGFDPLEPPPPPGVKVGRGVVQLDNVLPGTQQEFKLQLKGGREESLRLIAHQADGVDARLALIRDADGQEVASAGEQGQTSIQLRFTPPVTTVYRVRVRNLGKQAVSVTVTH